MRSPSIGFVVVRSPSSFSISDVNLSHSGVEFFVQMFVRRTSNEERILPVGSAVELDGVVILLMLSRVVVRSNFDC